MKVDPWVPPLDLNRWPPGKTEWSYHEPVTNATFVAPTYWKLCVMVMNHRLANPGRFPPEQAKLEAAGLAIIRQTRLNLGWPVPQVAEQAPPVPADVTPRNPCPGCPQR